MACNSNGTDKKISKNIFLAAVKDLSLCISHDLYNVHERKGTDVITQAMFLSRVNDKNTRPTYKEHSSLYTDIGGA